MVPFSLQPQVNILARVWTTRRPVLTSRSWVFTGQAQQRLAALEEHTTALQADLEALGAQDEAVAALTERLDALHGSGQADQEVAPWDWATMDREAAAQAWQVLTAWVRAELAGRRSLVGAPTKTGSKVVPRIPPCWYRHPDVVAELSWLCQEWIRIYRTGYGSPWRAGEWHDRWLPGLLRRISTSSAAGCGRTHVEPILEIHPGVDDDELLSQVIAADLADRPEPDTPAAADR